jgi:hypothetical protein
MEILITAFVAMGGQRHLLAGRKAVADDGIFVLAVGVFVGGAGGHDGEREESDKDGEDDAAGRHPN